MTACTLYAERALLAQGWADSVLLEIGDDGRLAAIHTGAAAGAAERAAGPVVPAMPNLHSHAFQRAMAGMAERAGGEDSFWGWRQLMYGFVARIEPDDLEAIAAQLYVEMLKAGYGAVAEFHYLHHDRDGQPYADPAEMSWRVLAAAGTAGIALVHLPVLYAAGGFGGVPTGQSQRRFLNGLEGFLEIVERVAQAVSGAADLAVGIAPHSLRAVPAPLLAAALAAFDRLVLGGPVHIHIAEQMKEVEECRAWSGTTPVAWLLDHTTIDRRWCLVHATHMTEAETAALAGSGAVAGLCPTTEANLGDGLFPAVAYHAASGRFGIGSDSHISVSPVEELRWLEYGQRLLHRRRSLLHGESGVLGTHLWAEAAAGGAQALGIASGYLESGRRADLVVLDGEAVAPVGAARDVLDAAIFAGNRNPVRDVMVGGCWVIRDRHHAREAEIRARYDRTVKRLLEPGGGR